MTALRQDAIRELEKLPEENVSIVLRIMKDMNELYDYKKNEKEVALEELLQMTHEGNITDYDKELSSYREEKYAK